MSAAYRKWLQKKLAKLQAIDCYSAGVTPEGLAEQLGVDPSKIVKLNFNENLFVDRAKQTALMKQLADEIDLRMYPEDEEAKLRDDYDPMGYISFNGLRFASDVVSSIAAIPKSDLGKIHYNEDHTRLTYTGDTMSNEELRRLLIATQKQEEYTPSCITPIL